MNNIYTVLPDDFDPDLDITTLYYDREKNRMMQEGFIVDWLFNLISPNIYYLFKMKKEDMIVRGLDGSWIELIWDLDSDDAYQY